MDNIDWMARDGLLENGLIQSNNPTTAAVFGSMGPVNSSLEIGGPFQLDKLLKKMNMHIKHYNLLLKITKYILIVIFHQ